MDQLNNLWFLKQGTPGNICQKPLYSKIYEKKAKTSLCRKLLFLFYFIIIIIIIFWPSICLKLETVHKFIKIKKKKWINVMHICDYWVGVDISIIQLYLSFMYIKIQEQYILEQYFYIVLHRQQIPTACLGRE